MAEHAQLVGGGLSMREQLGAHQDGGQRIAQVVAHDAHHLLCEQRPVVGPRALAGRLR